MLREFDHLVAICCDMLGIEIELVRACPVVTVLHEPGPNDYSETYLSLWLG